MIRDGYNFKLKRVNKRQKKFNRPEYTENMLASVVNAVKLYQFRQDPRILSLIKDPYGVLLLLDPKGGVGEKTELPEYPVLTCREYVEAILDDEIDRVWPKMSKEEREYAILADMGGIKANVPMVLETLAKNWDMDVKEVMKTYEFQPDPVPLAFGITAPRAELERFTPVVGIEYVQNYPNTLTESIRFPVLLSQNRFKGNWHQIQIHKDGSLFKTYPKTYELGVAQLLEQLKRIKATYVVDGFFSEETAELVIWDVLCWRDIWLHNRPLNERQKFLWHFEPYTESTLIAHNHTELGLAKNEYDGGIIARNLNCNYSAMRPDCMVKLGEITVNLKVGGRKGGVSRSYLNTSDKKSVFEVDEVVDKEDWGDIVQVNKKGEVLSVLPKSTLPDSWSDVSSKWERPIIYDEWIGDIRMPKCNWLKSGDDDDEEYEQLSPKEKRKQREDKRKRRVRK